MLFGSLFKNEKQIAVSKGRKRKLTVRDVISRLDKVDLTTANCTLIRDSAGNEKIEDYGQVDVFRVRDEKVFMLENGFAITTPTGMKLRAGIGGDSDLAQIVSEDDAFEMVTHIGEGQGEEEDLDGEDVFDDEEGGGAEDEAGPLEAVKAGGAEGEAEIDPDEVDKRPQRANRRDAFSEAGPRRGREAQEEDPDTALGVGEVIRLRFFYRRIPYEIDCQIVDRFNPVRYRNKDLTPRFGVGYHVRPLSDVRKRDNRHYVRYTHKLGFGHLRIRKEIQFHVYAHRTDLEIPDSGALSQTITARDFQTFPFGTQEVAEVKGAEQLENVVEFFMACMINNPSESRYVYLSKPFLDRTNRSSLEGLGYYNVIGAQQATILPKIFVKKQPKGRSVLERQMASKGVGSMDSRKLRIIEDIQDRYSLQTRELKLYTQRRRKKSLAGSFDNDQVLIGFSSAYGLPVGDVYTMRFMQMPSEVTDMGVENITLKPIPFEDSRARDLDYREFVRQEDGFEVDLLNFSVGGVLIRGGGEAQEHGEAFLKYLVGDEYEDMDFMEQVEALQRYGVLLHFYPVLNFARNDIKEFEPYSLPFRIPVIARVVRFRTAQNKDNGEPQITSIGLEFIYNPDPYSYSRDIFQYDKWEQITPYTENVHFIEVHKSLQLLFGFDKAKEQSFRSEKTKEEKSAEAEAEPQAEKA